MLIIENSGSPQAGLEIIYNISNTVLKTRDLAVIIATISALPRAAWGNKNVSNNRHVLSLQLKQWH